MKYKYINLLLTTTFLTACGSGSGAGGGSTIPSEEENKANKGITSDGTAGEAPTIRGGNTESVIAVLESKEAQDKFKPLRDNVNKGLQLLVAINSAPAVNITQKQIDEALALVPATLESAYGVYGIIDGIYAKATAEFKSLDAKGDYSGGDWPTISALNQKVNFFVSLTDPDKAGSEQLPALHMELGKELGLSYAPFAAVHFGVLDQFKSYKKALREELLATDAFSELRTLINAGVYSREAHQAQLEWRAKLEQAVAEKATPKQGAAKFVEMINDSAEINEKIAGAVQLLHLVPELSSKVEESQLQSLVNSVKDILIKNVDIAFGYLETADTFKKLTQEGVASEGEFKTEKLELLQRVVAAAIEKKLEKLTGEGVEEDKYFSDNGAKLFNTISKAMFDKGFILNERLDPSSDDLKLTPFAKQVSGESFNTSGIDLIKGALYEIVVKALNSDHNVSLYISPSSFGVTAKALRALGYTVPKDIKDTVIFSRTSNSGSGAVFSNNEQMTVPVHRLFYDPLNLATYKAFVSALIPNPEFKGLFDFLKYNPEFKKDAEFMALFNASPAQLSAGMIRDISAASLRQARTAVTGLVDARSLNMNGVAGQSVELDMPVFVQLKGEVSPAKSTEAATGSVAYRLGNTVIGAIQGYANSGAGFEADSRQLETSVVASHSFGSFFIEGQIGSVSATEVHGSNWSGVRSQLTLGLDRESVSPFVQVSNRQLDRDGEYALNDTTAYVGLEMDIANLSADTYSIDTRLLTKVGYGSKNWSKESRDLGSTSGLTGSVEWSASLNLNSGVAFSSNLALDTVAGSSAGLTVSLDR